MISVLTMWIVVIILGIADYKTESTRWAMRLTFFAGLAGCSAFWIENPNLIRSFFGWPSETYEIIKAILSALSHYFIPYCAIMFGISYSGVLKPKYQKIIPIILLIPLFITFGCYPTHDYRFKTDHQSIIYYRFLSVWALPYSLVSCMLQIYAYLKEDIPSQKRQRLTFCLIAVPGIVINSITTYLLGGSPVGQPWKYWKYNAFIILYMFVLFIYCLARYGVLGIKVRIEKQNLSNMMNVLNSGMKILSHSLKNEISKVSICMTNIQLSLAQRDINKDDIHENIKMVSASVTYLSDIVKELQKNSLDSRNFRFTQNNLGEMMEAALETVAVFLKAKNIQISKNVPGRISILCDKLYLQEVFINICQNAIEAMDFEGRLTIETSLTARGLIIMVKDNGSGISKEDLPHVMEPFFTTKDKKNNLGLGLAYCYNILKKHGAFFEVHSEQNIGTTISLYFPKHKIILN